jgi:4-hydroxyphenylacetate 3-monooxygenase
MPARTGRDYLKGLQEQDREIWLGGERVRDVTTHPGLRNGAQAIAALYDMQHDPALRDAMTYVSPTRGEPIGLSFIIPRTRPELEARRGMMLHWARTTCGMMGRSPDFMNVTFAAWAGAADYFAQNRPEFGANIRRYYEHIREKDLTLTHALINLQRSRTVSGAFNLQEGTALQAVRETDAGVVVRGARILATLGPLADEIAVYSPRLARLTETHSPFALNFAIPCGTPGLRFVCRESFDLGRSHFDHPLGSRFEEMDCLAVFDDVLVPWERVFLLGDVELLNATAVSTGSSMHSAHQARPRTSPSASSSSAWPCS